MMRKLFSTVAICSRLFMARTFGEYLHSTGGPQQADAAVYRWRGKTWSIPTGPLDQP